MFAPPEPPRCMVCDVVVLIPKVYTPILCELCYAAKAKANG